MSRPQGIAKVLPRAWTASILQLQRDAARVARGLRGERGPTFSTREGRGVPPADYGVAEAKGEAASRVLAPRVLRVARVVRETAAAVSVHLEDPSGAPFTFRPGQFFTVLFTIDGEPLRRAYSISSASPDRRTVAITVKRVAGGRVSSYVNETLAEGASIHVLGPSGSFTVDPAPPAGRHIVLIAGGSGITPMMAIAHSVLADEPESKVILVYGNRAEADIIFHHAISALERDHPSRFSARHVLSDGGPEWSGGRGLLGLDVLRAELSALPIDPSAEYFVCGPEPMMAAARQALAERGAAPEKVKEERFTTPHLRVVRDDAAASASPQILTVRMNGEARAMNVAPSQTVLEAALGAGMAMPYSCAMGGCAACKVKVCDGEVEMEEPNCLSAAERADGFVLACVSRLRTATTVEVPR